MRNLRILTGLLILAAAVWFLWSAADDKGPIDRDQIKKQLAEMYPQSKRLQRTLYEYVDPFIRIADGELDYQAISDEQDKRMDCLWALFPDLYVVPEMEQLVFNTHTRARRYAKYNAFFSGQIIEYEPKGSSQCNFDPSSYEN